MPLLVVLREPAALKLWIENSKIYCGLTRTTRHFKLSAYFIISVICAVITAGKAFSLSLQNSEKKDANSQTGYQMPWQMEPFNSHIKKYASITVFQLLLLQWGEVMRRRIQCRESLLPPVRTPHIISIVEVLFFGEFYPAVLGIWMMRFIAWIFCRDSSEETCGAFLKTLDANQVETIYVDPVDSLFSAVNQYFPMASIVVTDEAIKRYARNAMLDIIHSDGKRFPVVHKDRRLTVLHKDLDDRTVVPRIKEGMKSRPRLQRAYNHHQRLLELMETKWSMEDLRTWGRPDSDRGR